MHFNIVSKKYLSSILVNFTKIVQTKHSISLIVFMLSRFDKSFFGWFKFANFMCVLNFFVLLGFNGWIEYRKMKLNNKFNFDSLTL